MHVFFFYITLQQLLNDSYSDCRGMIQALEYIMFFS